MRKWYGLFASAAAVTGVACSEPTASLDRNASLASLTAALSSVPSGYGDLTSSYVGVVASRANDSTVWLGGGRGPGMGRGDMMGGGLHDAFIGGIGFGPGFGGGRGPFGGGLDCAGTFSSATGRVTCSTVTLRNGLTVSRSAAYANAQGQAQQAFDSLTTNTVNLRTEVNGTLTFTAPGDSVVQSGDSVVHVSNRGPGGGGHGGHGHGWGEGRGPGGQLLGDTARIVSATTTVHATSDRTVSGLAQGSTQRTVNGTSAGTETTSGTSSRGTFTATRTVGDTTTGLVVPVRTDSLSRPYPAAGTVVRSMSATLTYTGQSAVTVTRREVVTYDGSATARVVITENGTTRNCTRPLPRGPLTCS